MALLWLNGGSKAGSRHFRNRRLSSRRQRSRRGPSFCAFTFDSARRNRAAQVLNSLPDPAYGRLAVFELRYRRGARQAVPDPDQPGCGPVGRQRREAGFVPELFRVNSRLCFFRTGVNGDVVRLVVDGESLHFQSPDRASAAVHSGGKHKQAVQVFIQGRGHKH